MLPPMSGKMSLLEKCSTECDEGTSKFGHPLARCTLAALRLELRQLPDFGLRRDVKRNSGRGHGAN